MAAGMRVLLALCVYLLCNATSATKVAGMPLEKQVAGASDIAVARVEAFTARTKDGALLTKGMVRTGPGAGYTVLAQLRILRVLKGDALRPGMRQQVALWPLWHMEAELGRIRDPMPVIVLLKQSASGLMPVYAPDPYIPPHLEREVRALLRRETASAGH